MRESSPHLFSDLAGCPRVPSIGPRHTEIYVCSIHHNPSTTARRAIRSLPRRNKFRPPLVVYLPRIPSAERSPTAEWNNLRLAIRGPTPQSVAEGPEYRRDRPSGFLSSSKVSCRYGSEVGFELSVATAGIKPRADFRTV